MLLGSSARKLRRAGVNILGGRALQKTLFPLLPSELGGDFPLDEVLRFGSLPLVWNADSRRDQIEAYVQLYLKEEIQAEALVRNLPGFARFLPVASLFHGQVLNSEGLARDSGVARAARKQFHAPSPEERGSLFDGLIAQLLRAHDALGPGLYDDLYYWAVGRTAIEVDFLLQRGDSYTAIEVRSSERLDPAAFAGLKAVAELPNVARRILVYLGDHRFRHEAGIEVLPFAAFLEELEKGLWP